MRDVALMPKRHILEGRLCVGPYHPRQSTDLLTCHRIALMWHSGRTLLLLAEVLFRLANFGALQVADFGSDLVERRNHDPERCDIVGVEVAWDHLSRDRRRLQSESHANFFFIFRIEMAKISNCA